jgi:hypothetical protein
MPAATVAPKFYTFTVTVPSNAGSYVTLLSLLSVSQLAEIRRSMQAGQQSLSGDNQTDRGLEVEVTPVNAIRVSHKDAAATTDYAVHGAAVSKSYPVDDALGAVFVRSEAAATTATQIILYATRMT